MTILGDFIGYPIYVKHGRYGYYLAWNGHTVSVPALTPDTSGREPAEPSRVLGPGPITLEEARTLLAAKYPSPPLSQACHVPGNYQRKRVPRRLSPFLTLCRSKFGSEYSLQYLDPAKTGREARAYYSLDTFPGDAGKATDEALLSWTWAHYGLK